MPRLTLIHTAASNVAVFRSLCRELLPGVATSDVVDERLLADTVRAGRLEPRTRRRLVGYVGSAEEDGADAVLVTCSSLGPAIDLAAAMADVPVLRVDRPMAARAVREAARIGIAATLRSTLEPTVALVGAEAAAAGRAVEVRSAVAEGAFEALGRGDAALHDRLVADTLERLARDVELILLAQASMARVVDAMPAGLAVPVLSSPRLAIERVAEVLAARV